MIFGFGFWYFALVAWVYKFAAVINEGLAWVLVIVAAIAFYRFWLVETKE